MKDLKFFLRLARQIPLVSTQLAAEALLLRVPWCQGAPNKQHPFAARTEAIGPRWIEAMLRQMDGASTQPERLPGPLQRIGEDGQMSVIHRLRWHERGPESKNHTLVLKSTIPNLKHRLLNRTFGIFATEIRVYSLPKPERGLLRPHCWYAHQQSTSKAALMVLEDLSVWRRTSHRQPLSSDDTHRVVKALATHQALWWNKSAELSRHGLVTTLARHHKQDGALCRLALRSGIAKLAALIDKSTIATLRRIVELDGSYLHSYDRKPATLTHGDLNPNNLFFDDNNDRVFAIDWQAAHIGHWAEDLAYLLVLGLGAELPAEQEDAQLEAHRVLLGLEGVELDRSSHRHEYAVGLAQVGVCLVLATLILDQDKDPELYASYQDSIIRWSTAAKRHCLAERLAEGTL